MTEVKGRRLSSVEEVLKKLNPKKIIKDNSSLDDIIRYHYDPGIQRRPVDEGFRIDWKYSSLDELSDEKIGRIGERAIGHFLTSFNEFLTIDDNIKIEHPNKNIEAFLPYDFLIHKDYRGFGRGISLYVEVKTTRIHLQTPFHLSLPEAKCLLEHFNNYVFFRVFPLLEEESYLGIRVASNWGMNMYRISPKFKKQFESAVNEMHEVYEGNGFLLKAEWLEPVLSEVQEREKREELISEHENLTPMEVFQRAADSMRNQF